MQVLSERGRQPPGTPLAFQSNLVDRYSGGYAYVYWEYSAIGGFPLFDGRNHRVFDASSPLRVSFDATDAISHLASGLDQVLDAAYGLQPVIVCVGTDRSTGDAFGPIVGSRLVERMQSSQVQVYGTLDNPVHAVNLTQTLEGIEQRWGQNTFILAIDACLGRFEHVGQIILEEGPLHPGAGVKKALPEFGQFTLTGVVNVSGFMEYFVLQNTRLGIVMKMTEIVVQSLLASLHRHSCRESIRQLAKQPGSM